MAHLVTSSQNKDHVTSANAAHYNIGSFSDGCFALNTGDVFAASLQDANTLVIKSGDAIVCGRHWCIDSQEEVTIENGTPGYKRTDLIVARVETSPSEKITLVNYRGTDTTGTPATPSHTEGDLNNGDTVCEMPLYTVTVNGISPQTPVKLFSTIDNLSKVASNLSSVTSRTTSAESNINSLKTRTSTAETNITNLTTRMTTAETNIKNVGASVSPLALDSGWKDLINKKDSSNNELIFRYRKVGKIVFVVGWSYGNWLLNTSSNRTSEKLPVGYRPTAANTSAIMTGVKGYVQGLSGIVETDGSISLYTAEATTQWRFYSVFPA